MDFIPNPSGKNEIGLRGIVGTILSLSVSKNEKCLLFQNPGRIMEGV